MMAEAEAVLDTETGDNVFHPNTLEVGIDKSV